MNQKGRPDWENITILFSIYSGQSSPVEVCYLFELLKDLFDPLSDIEAVGFDMVRLDRLSQEPIPDPDKGWIYEVVYKIQLQKE